MSSSSASSNNVNTTSNGKNGTLGELTIDIRPLLEDVSQVMTKHISSILNGVVGEYTVYKETHDTIMKLPCVQRLNERIIELEHQLNGGGESGAAAMTAAVPVGGGGSCADISQLQSAIVELNRYIQVLESRISVPPQSTETALLPQIQEEDHDHDNDDHDDDESSQSPTPLQEESIRLEVHETGDDEEGEQDEPDEEEDPEDPDAAAVAAPAVADKRLRSSMETNRIIESTPDAMEDEEEEQEETDEDDLAGGDDDNDEEELDIAEDETEPEIATTTGVEVTEEDDAVEEEEDVEEDQDAVEEDAVEEEEDAVEEEEDAVEEEEDAVEEEGAVEEEDAEDEIEVSEIKINGATYFTTNPQNGIIYACVDDDVGDEVGIFKNGVALFSKNKSATK